MINHICLYEDHQYTSLLPLVYFRPVYNLKCGAFSLREKLLHAFPGVNLSLRCRDYLAPYMRLRNPSLRVNESESDETLFLNGRLIVDDELIGQLNEGPSGDVIYQNNGEIIAFRISSKRKVNVNEIWDGGILQTPLPNIPAISVNAKMIRYPWDLIGYLKKELTADLLWMKKEWAVQKDRRMIHPGAYLIDEDNIFIGEGSTLKPGCVLDAEEGPIVIGRGVTVMPQSTIIGPVYIADGSVVKVGAKIYEGTSIGPVCKIGGEIEGSIIHGYSNKQHDGFLGHSYLCAWVNLGAGTTNSDLKNNYGPVRIQLGNQFIDTGLQFVGSFIGDHSKTAINSTLNTGTVIGVCSNIFGSGFPPKCVPSFSWGAAGETLTTYTIEHALDVAKRVMERRKVQLLDSEQQLFRDIFALTQPERMLRGMPA